MSTASDYASNPLMLAALAKAAAAKATPTVANQGAALLPPTFGASSSSPRAVLAGVSPLLLWGGVALVAFLVLRRRA